tara:strand:- start:1428 stop:1676 length:249 start_codon:yes stop_codon:yes gene_type:complete
MSIIVLPWWAALIIAIYATFRFPNFFEVIIFAFVFDSLYGFGVAHITQETPIMEIVRTFVFTVAVIPLFVLVELIKPYLRFY